MSLEHTSQEGLPAIDMMIVGAPKAGTTSLKAYLGQHPHIVTHVQRELIYFASDVAYEQGYEHVLRVYFGDARPKAGAFVAKSVAMMYSPVAMQRLREHNADVQVVLVLREPIARAYSEYWYALRRGHETAASFEQALDRSAEDSAREPRAYLARSRYAESLATIGELFPRSQINVVILEQMERDPVAACQALFARLPGVDPWFVPASTERENVAAAPRSKRFVELIRDRTRLTGLRNVVRALLGQRQRQQLRAVLHRFNETPLSPPPMSTATRRRLEAYFEPWNRRLEDLIGESLDVWRAPPPR